MSDLFCPFSLTLVSGAFGCSRGHPVVRRSGPDVACSDADSRARCAELFAALKAAALASFDTVDDPASMPHGVAVRIQHGGLLGLARTRDPQAQSVADVETLAAACCIGGAPEIVPEVVEAMHDYRPRRRGRR